MIYRPKPTDPAYRLLWGCLAIAGLWLLLSCASSCSSSKTPADAGSSTDEQTPTTEQETAVVESGPVTAETVLRRMAAAYKKATRYADRGTVRLVAHRADEQMDQTEKFSLAMVRPNKLRMEFYRTKLVCNGKLLSAAIEDLPNQVLAKQAPAELTVRRIYADPVLRYALCGGFAGPSPQLMLLLADEPLKDLLAVAQETVLEAPGTIAGRNHYRVKIQQPVGTLVLWIDQQTYVLRRIEFPTDELRQMLSQEGTVEDVSLVAELTDARLGGSIDPTAFQFEAPADAERVEFFPPPHPARLLGTKVSGYKFFDLDGNPVTSESLAGKIVVLNFWASGWKPSHDNLLLFEKVYQQYISNDQIAWVAVNVNSPEEANNQELQDTFAELGVHVPILRDQESNAGLVFSAPGMAPVVIVVDAEGVVQHCEVDHNPKLDAILPEKLEKVLAGEDIYQGSLETYRKELEQYQRNVEAAAEGPLPGEHEVPDVEIADRSEPATFQRSRLWKCSELSGPGNILVVASAEGPPRLMVVDQWKSVAEVGLDGKMIARHQLPIEPIEVVSNLRTGLGADGKRYFAALAYLHQRFHLFDQDWKLVLSFPQDALKNTHQGITDVQLGDLQGDGTIKAYVGYRGVVGVQEVSPDGKRRWWNRSLADVARLAIGGPDEQGARRLYCTSSNGFLAVIDAKGQRQGEVMVPGQFLHWITAADLNGDGRPQWCGLTTDPRGNNVAIGLNLQGERLWSYALPEGVHRQPIEPVVAGQLQPGGPRQWLLPGADGSIHILAADGKLLDRFNYGAELTGLATAELDGRPVLMVASSNGLEAWKVE